MAILPSRHRVAITTALLACMLLSTLVSADTFTQVTCSGSSCNSGCTDSQFIDGYCYEVSGGGSARSHCYSSTSTLKSQVFPFTKNCTRYSSETKNAVGECLQNTQEGDYVIFFCAALDANSTSISKNKTAGSRSIRRMPMIVPYPENLANEKTLTSSVELTHGGTRMRIASITPIFEFMTPDPTVEHPQQAAPVDMYIRKVAINEQGEKIVVGGEPVLLEDACRVGALTCDDITATRLSIRLDVLKLYTRSLLKNEAEAAAIEVTFVGRESRKPVFTVKL